MAANKKKQDEKHLKMLRDMVALPNNKECFDCHQRGPTYVNMTTGSYVCTACSGLLRGLNPPHRVKSISMASFTPEEMEFLKCHGNEFCRKVWLGLYDTKAGLEPDSREEQKVKDFMLQKYEKKRYYVAPTEVMKDEARQINEGALNKQPATKPLKALLGENAPRLVVDNQEDEAAFGLSDNFQSLTVSGNNLTEPGNSVIDIQSVIPALTVTTTAEDYQKKNLPPVKAPPVIPLNSQSSQVTTPQSPGNVSQSSKSSGSTTMDLLGDLGGDPFASSASAHSHPAGGGGFADFGSFGTQFTKQSAAPVSAALGFTSSNPLQPMAPGSTPSVSANGPFSSANSNFHLSHSGDKYAALSSLEDVFSSTSSTSHSTTGNLDWKGTGSSTTPATAINWGGSSGPSGGSGISWNSQGKTASEGMTSVNWSGSSSSGGGGSGGVNWNSSSASVNPTTVANPFGGAGSTQNSMTGMGVANPFGSTGSQNLFSTAHSAPQQSSGYGQFATPGTAGGFGQFGTAGMVPNTAGGGFGQFGTTGVGMVPSTVSGFGQYNSPASTSAGFGGQFGIQNGGFGTGVSASQGFHGFGGQQVPAYSGGGWGQMPSSSSANPFMTAATQQQPARGSSTNPFL